MAAVILTAKLGRIQFNGHDETYYNLNMSNIVERADQVFNVSDMYWIREDGCKMYGPFIIVAANWKEHPFGSVVETSRGTGLVLDTGDFAKREPQTIDLAVEW